MSSEGINFPVYRKYKNNKSYFKILSEKEFEQIQVIGSKYRLIKVKAGIYPEIRFIRDLITEFEGMAYEISAEEYESLMRRI